MRQLRRRCPSPAVHWGKPSRSTSSRQLRVTPVTPIPANTDYRPTGIAVFPTSPPVAVPLRPPQRGLATRDRFSALGKLGSTAIQRRLHRLIPELLVPAATCSPTL